MYKIALLIPTTSRNQNINNIHDLSIFKWLIPTLVPSLSNDEKNNNIITIFLGVDDNDVLYTTNPQIIDVISSEFNYLSNNTNLTLKIVKCNNTNHNPVRVWNLLFQIACDEQYDYFYQLGDDIEFLSSNWLTKFIKALPTTNIGIIGPYDINPTRPVNLITQSFTNRNHIKIFNTYYPDIFTNWYSDNWIQGVYGNNSILLTDVRIKNAGGKPKYIIDNKNDVLNEQIKLGKDKINKFLLK
jgi:hypothetical protein